MFKQVESPTLIDITVFHIAVYLLVPVLFGNNRLTALVSASFAFGIINLAHLPVMYFIFLVISPFVISSNYVDFIQQNPQIYYGGIFITNIIITVCCLFAARWLGETSLKPPLKTYALFNLFFILFPLAILLWYEDMLAFMSISYLSSAIVCTLFLGIILFLFYLYTRLTANNLNPDKKNTKGPPSSAPFEAGEYTQFIQYLSKREFDVIEAVLAGNVSYKAISAALNISVNTVKAHLKHIYKTTGVSNVPALSTLFRGFTAHNHTS